ncbi:hypothetical protein K466DRAFT_588278 [Polyporus arcularius HHB13444]|uniref:Uncharacterized protein n=1 Tax=Polyporus arcularius HHB13444 TaxID=1314778 RepID=A0A5C3P6C6_9APHY|nr:hypothetical protein K466DRAFT_588278 [Polyporus arcularius HHB13444]
MQQCLAQTSGENGQQTRCTKPLPPGKPCCEEHSAEFWRQMDAYRKVYEELCTLEKLVEGIFTSSFTLSRNPEEVGKMVETVNAYTECIQRAVVGWHEHTSQFFVEPDPAFAECLKALRHKRTVALAIAANIEDWKQHLLMLEEQRMRQTPEERAQEVASQRQVQQVQVQVNQRIRERGNTSTYDVVMTRCAAHLAYDEQTRCATPARKPERFCPVHREEHRLASLKLDQVMQAAEESHARTDATMNNFRSGRARTTDVTANVRSYLAALDEELQVVEVHQQLFQFKPAAEHAEKVDHLRSQRELVKQVLDSTIAEEEKDEFSGEVLLVSILGMVGRRT